MSNTFGQKFRITTSGESHGKSISVIVDGCPAGLFLQIEDIQKELDRRKPGQSKVTTQRKEADLVEIHSGVFEDKTTGTSIMMLIPNTNFDSSKYEPFMNVFRPGTGDYTYWKKYGIRDWRGGGRASGRETAARVAAGAIAKKILEIEKIKVIGYTIKIRKIDADRNKFDFEEIEKNLVRCPDKEAAKIMEEEIIRVKKLGNSVGGMVEIIAKGVPPGLGEPIFGKLDEAISDALGSIGAVKAVEIGAGVRVAEMYGSECNDQMTRDENGKIKFLTNNAGGILGGISTGQDIIARIAVKPTPSISMPQETVDTAGNKTTIEIKGDHDPCICPRIVPVAEAMVALVLVDYLLLNKTSKL